MFITILLSANITILHNLLYGVDPKWVQNIVIANSDPVTLKLTASQQPQLHLQFVIFHILYI